MKNKLKKCVFFHAFSIKNVFFFTLFSFLVITQYTSTCYASYRNPRISEIQATRAIIGESASEDYRGMLAVACGIRNRGTLKGVVGLRNRKMINRQPRKVWVKARKAWRESRWNRIHRGNHWENIKKFRKPYWWRHDKIVYRVGDHTFLKL